MEIKIITLRLPVALIQAIDAMADATQQSGALRGPSTRSDVIRDALVAHVQDQQKQVSSGRVTVRSMRR